MIDRNDIIDALSKATAYDPMHTPKPSTILVQAWVEHFGRYAQNVTRDDLMAAVTEYHREPHDRVLQPADLSLAARMIRRDHLDRLPLESPERLALEARADAKAELPAPGRTADADAHSQRLARVLARFNMRDEDDAKAADYLTALVDSPLRVACPWCKASIGTPCTVPATGIVLTKIRAHPSRMDAAKSTREDSHV